MANPLKAQNVGTKPAMAGLLLCVMSALMSGCLIPQDDTVPFDQPIKRNSPLRIVDQKPVTQRTTFYASTACSSQNEPFELKVNDDDLSDTIHSLWFIDQGPNTVPFQTTPRAPTGSSIRSISAPSALTFTNALSNLTTGIHLLTVYVADSNFDEVVDGVITVTRPDVTLPTGEMVTDRGYVDSYTWVLDVERCP